MKRIYQHCGEQYLHRYLAELELRYNNRASNGMNDRQQAEQSLCGIVGNRLMYSPANASRLTPALVHPRFSPPGVRHLAR